MIQIIIFILLFAIMAIAGLYLRNRFRMPSRHYEGLESVSDVYDNWARDRITEYYWGEHIHAGHYGDPPVEKDFIAAKVDFVDEMIKLGIAAPNPILFQKLNRPGITSSADTIRILDVGCGIGGSSRHMAKRWKQTAHVIGITISKEQAKRAVEMAQAQGVTNVTFLECDASQLTFSDESFDVVWSVEAEMHMPDKEHFVREMVRVLKPGGTLLIAAWNVRDTRLKPLSKVETKQIQFLVDEWAHAKFISIREYKEIFKKNNLEAINAENWAVPTQPSWRQAIEVALRDPSKVMNISMRQRWWLIRDAYTMLRYDEAFRTGLCEYGMIWGQKAK